MEMAPQKIFVRIGGEIRGPFAPPQLRELAEVAVIMPATEAAETPAGPWTRLEVLPWSAPLFPRRAEMSFKPAAFEKTNRDSAPPVDHRELIALAYRPPANLPPPLPAAGPAGAGTPPKPEPRNEVEEMVREVARREAELPPPVLEVKRRGKRRLVHYLVLLVAGNATLAAIPWYYGGPFDEFTTLVILSWFLFYNAGLAYAMFGLVPRY